MLASQNDLTHKIIFGEFISVPDGDDDLVGRSDIVSVGKDKKVYINILIYIYIYVYKTEKEVERSREIEVIEEEVWRVTDAWKGMD